MGDISPEASSAFGNLLEPYSEELFQSSVVDPAMKTYEQQMLPQLQQRFVDANASSSSALNQALAQSAGDMSSLLAGQRLDLQQAAAQRQQGALGGLVGLAGGKTMEPIVQGPKPSLLGNVLQGAATAGMGWLFSSKEVKENIKDYDKGLETLRGFRVKQYDYKPEVEVVNHKGRVGLIAEELPEEITGYVDNIKAVDLYGLVSILINSIKQLDAKISDLEKK